MDIKIALTLGGVMAILVGVALGYLLRWFISVSQRGSVELEIKQVLFSAKEEAQRIIEEADKKAETQEEELKQQEKEQEQQFKKTEERLIKKEDFLDKRQLDVAEEVEQIKEKTAELSMLREKVVKEKDEAAHELERIARLSEQSAREELLKRTEKAYEEDILTRIKKLEREGSARLELLTRDILATSIQRLASSTASEIMTTTVTIPSDEIKGKIIGAQRKCRWNSTRSRKTHSCPSASCKCDTSHEGPC